MAAQARYETVTAIRNGEQFLLLIILLILALTWFRPTPTSSIPSTWTVASNAWTVAVLGVRCCGVISSAFSGQGIQTGFLGPVLAWRAAVALSTTPWPRRLIGGEAPGHHRGVGPAVSADRRNGCSVRGWRRIRWLYSAPSRCLRSPFTGRMLTAAPCARKPPGDPQPVRVKCLKAGGGVLFPTSVLLRLISRWPDLLPSAAAGNCPQLLPGRSVRAAPALVLAVWKPRSAGPRLPNGPGGFRLALLHKPVHAPFRTPGSIRQPNRRSIR